MSGLVAVLSFVVMAAPSEVRVPCEGFTLHFTSPSGEPTEDDELLEVEVDGQRFPVPFPRRLFVAARARFPSAHLTCGEGVPAVEVRPGVWLLLLTRSGRPQLDLISLALIDLKARKTLAVLETPHALASGRRERDGQVTFAFVHREVKGGVDVRAVREWLPHDDSPDGAMEDWLAVRVVGNRLSARWLRP